jgi:long-chain acyl-CoA synthetase
MQRPSSAEHDMLAQVQSILSRLSHIDPCEITPASDLDLDLGLDSLSRVELTVMVEEEFGVELDEKELSELKTVRQLIELIERKEPNSKAIPFPTWSLRPTIHLLRTIIQRLAVFPLHSLLCRPFKVEGRENLDNLKLPALFIANHTSHVDTLSILRALPRRIRRQLAVAAAADYFFRNRALSVAAPLMLNTFPLSRKGAVRASLEYCGELVDANWSILIYPEGTRSSTARLQPFKNGIGLLATELQVPVVPVGVQGGFQILPKGRSRPRPGPVKVRFGAPIEVPRDADNLAVVSVLENAVANLVRGEKPATASMILTKQDDVPIGPRCA